MIKRLDKAIKKAHEFLFSRRDNNGLWRDFYIRNYGESVDWISSYTGLSLLNSGISISVLKLTANSLFERQNNRYPGWGFDRPAPPDADSTAFAVMFLSHFQDYREEIDKSKMFLLKHQRENGSVQTYLPEIVKPYVSYDVSVEGWCSGIPGVTATFLQALGENQKAVRYMLTSQTQEGYWKSYWYTNDTYSTSHAIFALRDYEECRKQVLLAQEWVSQRLNFKVPFYLALSLQALIGNNNHNEVVKQGIERLLDMQEQDGSWADYPVLRFPLPSNLEPWRNMSRLREDARDQNRVFTTATCLQALHKYNKIHE